jgi:hypothetical protein
LFQRHLKIKKEQPVAAWSASVADARVGQDASLSALAANVSDSSVDDPAVSAFVADNSAVANSAADNSAADNSAADNGAAANGAAAAADQATSFAAEVGTNHAATDTDASAVSPVGSPALVPPQVPPQVPRQVPPHPSQGVECSSVSVEIEPQQPGSYPEFPAENRPADDGAAVSEAEAAMLRITESVVGAERRWKHGAEVVGDGVKGTRDVELDLKALVLMEDQVGETARGVVGRVW